MPPQVLQIYRMLPRTNCGDCGESACMAFALKVQTGQQKLSDCIHVAGGAEAGAPALSETVEDSYEQAGDRLEARLRDADFQRAAQAVGGVYVSREDCIRFMLLGGLHEVRREGLFVGGNRCRDSWLRLIAYDYVLRMGDAPQDGTWVPFDAFPRCPSHVKAFHKRAEAGLAKAFDVAPDAVREHLRGLEAADMPGDAKASLACRVLLLPRVPVYVQFWAADSEFPANCRLLVDRSATEYLDIEFVARLIERFWARVAGRESQP